MDRERDIFRPYLERKYQTANAVTYGEKIAVIDDLIVAVKQGVIPTSPDQVVKLNPDSPPVAAVRNGQAISLDGRSPNNMGSKPRNRKKRNLVLAMLLLSLLPAFGMIWWLAARNEAQVVTASSENLPTVIVEGQGGGNDDSNEEAPEPVPAQTTAIPSINPTAPPPPTFTPVPITPESYEVKVTEKQPLAMNNNPIALSFAGRDFRVHSAETAAVWEPTGVEWWPGTTIRRVFAVPFEQSLLDAAFAEIGTALHIRLRTGNNITYRLDNVARVNRLAIEHMLSREPGVAIVLYDEPDADDPNQRWLITGSAIQDTNNNTDADLALLTPIDDITLNTCQQQYTTITCSISATDETAVDQLYLTDRSWLDLLDNVAPTQVLTLTTTTTGTTTALLSGVVRPDGSPVLARMTANGIQAQLIQLLSFTDSNSSIGE